jgi:hypothetical protein
MALTLDNMRQNGVRGLFVAMRFLAATNGKI